MYFRGKHRGHSRGEIRIEVIIALFIIIVVAGMSLLTMNTGIEQEPPEDSTYTVEARFDNVSGLKPGSLVTASGVAIGMVSSIDYDNETYEAVVGLSINNRFNRFPLDTAASILSTGLMGEKYIDFQPGADDILLQDGDMIDLTQSAMILEQVIGQFIYNQSHDDEFLAPPSTGEIPEDIYHESGQETGLETGQDTGPDTGENNERSVLE